MEECFRVEVSKDRLEAKLHYSEPTEKELSITEDDLRSFLKKNRITFGINSKLISQIANNIKSVKFPLVIAQGIAPKNGHDAYLVNEIKKEEKRERLSFRDVINIPSVEKGQLLATVVPETPGTPGKDVYGNEIKARNGKPLLIRAGKNVLFHLEQFFSTTDGQLSITNRAINVNPVYEILGDLDMKTGNIDFTGNVVIRGNVPTGYKVKAGGDIQVFGLVEGAHLQASGNIFISGGISGEKRGVVIANNNIEASYINQADVEAGGDIIARTSIMHSTVRSGGTVNCESGSIIGGTIEASENILAKDVGNHLFTKTVLQVGNYSSADEKEEKLRAEINQLTETIKKLRDIETKLSQLKKLGKLTNEQLALMSKQKATMDQLTEQLFDKDEQLKTIESAKNEIGNLKVCVSNTVFPNSHIRFGKYAKVIQKKHQNAQFTFQDKEIHFNPYL